MKKRRPNRALPQQMNVNKAKEKRLNVQSSVSSKIHKATGGKRVMRKTGQIKENAY